MINKIKLKRGFSHRIIKKNCSCFVDLKKKKNCSIKLMLPIKYWSAIESVWHPASPQPRACMVGWLFKDYCSNAMMCSCCKHQNNVIMRELSVCCCLRRCCSSFLLVENVNMWALKESLASLFWNLILKSQG